MGLLWGANVIINVEVILDLVKHDECQQSGSIV